MHTSILAGMDEARETGVFHGFPGCPWGLLGRSTDWESQKDAFPTFTRLFFLQVFLEEHLKFNVVRVGGVPRLSLLQSLGVLGFPAFSFSPSMHRTLTCPYAHLLLIIQM